MTSPQQISTNIGYSRQSRGSSTVRAAFFAVNFAAGVLFCAASLLGIVQCSGGVGSFFGFLGGVIMLGPSAALAVAEWVAFYRNNRHVERVLGWAMFGLAAFTVFGIVANVCEAMLPPKPDRHAASIELIVWFIAIGVIIVTYFGCCGFYRLRHMRRQEVAADAHPPI